MMAGSLSISLILQGFTSLTFECSSFAKTMIGVLGGFQQAQLTALSLRQAVEIFGMAWERVL